MQKSFFYRFVGFVLALSFAFPIPHAHALRSGIEGVQVGLEQSLSIPAAAGMEETAAEVTRVTEVIQELKARRPRIPVTQGTIAEALGMTDAQFSAYKQEHHPKMQQLVELERRTSVAVKILDKTLEVLEHLGPGSHSLKVLAKAYGIDRDTLSRQIINCSEVAAAVSPLRQKAAKPAVDAGATKERPLSAREKIEAAIARGAKTRFAMAEVAGVSQRTVTRLAGESGEIAEALGWRRQRATGVTAAAAKPPADVAAEEPSESVAKTPREKPSAVKKPKYDTTEVARNVILAIANDLTKNEFGFRDPYVEGDRAQLPYAYVESVAGSPKVDELREEKALVEGINDALRSHLGAHSKSVDRFSVACAFIRGPKRIKTIEVVEGAGLEEVGGVRFQDAAVAERIITSFRTRQSGSAPPTQGEVIEHLARDWAYDRGTKAKFDATFADRLRRVVVPQQSEEILALARRLGIPADAVPRDPTARAAILLVPLHTLRGGIADFEILVEWAGQRGLSWLQILPLQEGSPGNLSPYDAWTAFGANPRPIVPERVPEIVDLLGKKQEESGELQELLDRLRRLRFGKHTNRATALSQETDLVLKMLRHGYGLFRDLELPQGAVSPRAAAFLEFQRANQDWLEAPYAIFRTLMDRYPGGLTPKFPEDPSAFPPKWMDTKALRDPGRRRALLAQEDPAFRDDVLFYQYVQWIFQEQWDALLRKAAESNVHVLGDIPIYVNRNSDAVWWDPDSFDPAWTTGCPPDIFSLIGQFWGQYPYNWPHLKRTGYALWKTRIRRIAALVHGVRVDHVRAFYDYYKIPPAPDTAKWLGSAGEDATLGDLFARLRPAWRGKIWVTEATPQVTGLPFPLSDPPDPNIPYRQLGEAARGPIDLVMRMLDADWAKGPADDFLQMLVRMATFERLGLVVGENLGLLSDGVGPMLQRSGIPGMVMGIYGFFFNEATGKVEVFPPYWVTQGEALNAFRAVDNHDTSTYLALLGDWAGRFPQALPQLAAILRAEGTLVEGSLSEPLAHPVASLDEALTEREAASRARYFAFSYQNLFQITAPTNVPGETEDKNGQSYWSDVFPADPRDLLTNTGPVAKAANNRLGKLLSSPGVNRSPQQAAPGDKPRIAGMLPQAEPIRGVPVEQRRQIGENFQVWASVVPAKDQTEPGQEPKVEMVIRNPAPTEILRLRLRLYAVLDNGVRLYYGEAPAEQVGVGMYTMNAEVRDSAGMWHAAASPGNEPRLIISNPEAGLEEQTPEACQKRALESLSRLYDAWPETVGTQVMVFTDPNLFDLAALSVRWGWKVAVPYDGPEIVALEQLLLALPEPRGEFGIGGLQAARLLEKGSPIQIENRPQAFDLLGLRWNELPPPVILVLETVRAFLDTATAA